MKLLEVVRQIGGDTYTIAAMAGAIWGSDRGLEAFDTHMIHKLEKSDELLQLGSDLFDASVSIEP